jgi:phosphatidylglycerol lysyltransferase
MAPAIVLGAIAAASLAYLTDWLQPLDSVVEAALSIDMGDANPTFAILSAIGLGSLSVGLLRGKQVAWWLAVATLAAVLVGQSSILQYPLRTVAIGGVLAILLADRRRYTVQTHAGWRRLIVGLLLFAGVAVGLETSLVIAATGSWPAPLAVLSDATSALGNALGISDDRAGQLLRGSGLEAMLALLLLAARLPMVMAALGILARIPEPPTDPLTRERAHAIGARFGHGALLPFQMGKDKLVFSPPETDGMIVYGLVGRTAVVLGDPIGPPEAAPRLLAAFLSFCRREDRTPVVYQASGPGRTALIDAGFRLFRVGQEAVVDLASFNLAGPQRANLRHTVTRFQRAGVSTRWFGSGVDAAVQPELMRELRAIDVEWRARVGPEMGFTIGRFDTASLGCQPVSVAVDEIGHALGFTTYLQTGNDDGWVIDLMRRAPGSPPGVVESCIVEAAQSLATGGAPTLSLGLAPLTGLDPAGPMEERLLRLGARLVSSRYDVAGLAFFKSKFDPIWVPRYGAIRRRADFVGFVVALLRVHLRLRSALPRWPRRSIVVAAR